MNPSGSSDTDRFPLSQIRRVVDACDRFEADLRGGRSPRIEAYLAQASAADRLALLRELLTLEVEHRIKGGWEPSPAEYYERFPEQEALVDFVIDEAKFSTVGPESDESLGGEIDPETTQGPTNPFAKTVTYTTPAESELGEIDEAHDPRTADMPAAIGRYRIETLLGEGGFGRVYQAYDAELNRRVAIKVPHRFRTATARDVESYFAEARVLASLDHPGIVPVFDVGRTEAGDCYIVSKLIEGCDLAVRLKQGRPGHREAAMQVAAAAEALHHAHTRGLVHRDVKARNILIDRAGRAYLADFGLALKEEDFGKGPTFAGTPIYMSPEQARGEGHLVDGRSDIFSLGVVFYEMLTGTRPFKAGTWEETIARIKTLEVRPPRQLDDSIPKELERICLKALAKRLSDRYSTALDLADDLQHALRQLVGPGPAGGSGVMSVGPSPDSDASTVTLHVVPKGLRCFDAEDADFFLRLLPGPRDREGLPESLRFWKTRVEATDVARAFRVGLVYGPSGCGKSSLIRAGLVPRLDGRIRAVTVEATPDETESRLGSALRRQFAELPPGHRLPALLTALRRGRGLAEGEKVLLVIDQFEQWLHANRAAEDSELVQALRQCDGQRIQCLLIVRDDFWMSVTRFMQQLEVRLVEGQNSAAVDLFDERHAKKVLTAFGRAFDVLPAFPNDLDREQQEFIDQAVSGLAENGKVVCVQLSLFAEMVKGKAWTPSTLKEVGGTQGVGVAFLDETFSAATSPPEHRRHQRAVREVLRALLPEQGTEIKGYMRPRAALLEASGYTAEPRDFDELLLVLDNELRLITPTDPQGTGADPGETRGDEPRYQLTHDYLVPALRDWLSKKQRETRRGRAELRLAERAALWGSRREKKQLPSFLEWLDIRLYAPRDRWTERERQMMQTATRRHVLGVARAVLAVGAAVVLGLLAYGYSQANTLVDRLLAADTTKVPEIVRQLGPFRGWADPRLYAIKKRAPAGSRESLHAALALFPVDRGQVAELIEHLLEAERQYVGVIREALAAGDAEVKQPLWRVVQDVDQPRGRRIRAACTLARYDPLASGWNDIAPGLVSLLMQEDGHSLVYWSELLRPVRGPLVPPLRKVFLERQESGQLVLDGQESDHGQKAALLLADYLADQPQLLIELILEADPWQLSELLPEEPARKPPLLALVRDALAGEKPTGTTQSALDRFARRKANAAITLASVGEVERLWPLLVHGEDQRVRSYLIERLPRFAFDPSVLVRQLHQERTASIRQALLLCLGYFGPDLLPQSARKRLLPTLVAMYGDDPDPGVHSAIDWLLGRWSFGAEVKRVDDALKGQPSERRWRVNSEGHTMVRVDPLVFEMGSPPGEDDRNPDGKTDETQHTRRINRTFEIATKEVTVAQILRSPIAIDLEKNRGGPECPAVALTWWDAARYCRWLSEQEDIPPDQMCFPEVGEIADNERVQLPHNYLARTGYRLPTEAEWEAACRAGTITPRYYGNDVALLNRYGWNHYNANLKMHPVGLTLPNNLGLFDMMGNAYERCIGPRIGTFKESLYPKGPVDDDPLFKDHHQVAKKAYLVVRGGAAHRSREAFRSAYRTGDNAHDQNVHVGFRIVRTLDARGADSPQRRPAP